MSGMEQDELLLKKRFAELAARADASGRYAYTPFLSLAEQDVLRRAEKELPIGFELYGGAEGCERVMARFGSEAAFGYDEPYPIKLIAAVPKGARFADKLTHRDILGSLMALGIERGAAGDIVLRGNTAYIFIAEHMAGYVTENLTQAKHTPLNCAECAELPGGELYRLTRQELTVSSTRLDCIAAAFCRLSRGDMQELIKKGLVFINGRQTVGASKTVEAGDIVSVRGYGRFKLLEELRKTKKDRQVIAIGRYE